MSGPTVHRRADSSVQDNRGACTPTFVDNDIDDTENLPRGRSRAARPSSSASSSDLMEVSERFRDLAGLTTRETRADNSRRNGQGRTSGAVRNGGRNPQARATASRMPPSAQSTTSGQAEHAAALHATGYVAAESLAAHRSSTQAAAAPGTQAPHAAEERARSRGNGNGLSGKSSSAPINDRRRGQTRVSSCTATEHDRPTQPQVHRARWPTAERARPLQIRLDDTAVRSRFSEFAQPSRSRQQGKQPRSESAYNNHGGDSSSADPSSSRHVAENPYRPVIPDDHSGAVTGASNRQEQRDGHRGTSRTARRTSPLIPQQNTSAGSSGGFNFDSFGRDGSEGGDSFYNHYATSEQIRDFVDEAQQKDDWASNVAMDNGRPAPGHEATTMSGSYNARREATSHSSRARGSSAVNGEERSRTSTSNIIRGIVRAAILENNTVSGAAGDHEHSSTAQQHRGQLGNRAGRPSALQSIMSVETCLEGDDRRQQQQTAFRVPYMVYDSEDSSRSRSRAGLRRIIRLGEIQVASSESALRPCSSRASSLTRDDTLRVRERGCVTGTLQSMVDGQASRLMNLTHRVHSRNGPAAD